MANMGSKNRVLYALIIGICIGLFSPSLLQTLIGDSQPTSYTNQESDDARDQSLEAYARQRERIRRHANALDSSASKMSTKQRKILLDCGANVASTIMMFRETYPGGEDFEIHSFEIDDRLAPYFAAHHGVNLHCPVGVSNKTGFMTAYSEAPWSPKKPLNNGKDMQWGGGTLFVSDDEKKDDATGGKRLLSHRKKIPVVDLSRWIQEHTSQEDYVIFKLDVEGAEFDILDKMIKDGTFKWIDKMYGEYHYSQPHGWDKKGRDRIKAAVKKQGHEEVDWAGEQRDYGDFDTVHPNHVTKYTPGEAGHVYSTCQPKTIAVTVAVGMNFKRAQRLIDTITAYPAKVPVTLFFYGDFVQQYPDAVLRWSNKFDIGLREDSYYPPMNFELFAYNWIRAGLVSSEMKFRNLGIQPSFYLPLQLSVNVTANAKARGFRIIRPSAVFPPPLDYPVALFNRTAYYAVRDVERIPKALRVIYQQLEVNNGGILALDSDLPDSFMNIVFLFDYLVRASDFNLVNVDNCVRMNSS